MASPIDIVGIRFGRLVAIKDVKKRCGKRLRLFCQCKCDCGRVTVVEKGAIKSGATQSCGCLRIDKSRDRGTDLTGRRFGRLTVISLFKRTPRVWLCKCVCGKLTPVAIGSLLAGLTKSCGCLHREIVSVRNAVDITNMRFGRLIAVERVGSKKYNVQWRCRCDCGGSRIASAGRLTCGGVRSCGCERVAAILSRNMGIPREAIPLEVVLAEKLCRQINKHIKDSVKSV